MKIFISPEWIYPVAKQTENNKLTNLTININSQHIQHDEVGTREIMTMKITVNSSVQSSLRLSVNLSVCPVDRRQQWPPTGCCWAPRGQQISTDCCTALSSKCGQSHVDSFDVRGWTQKFLLMSWASAHRGKWDQPTPAPWKNGWKIKKQKHAEKRSFLCLCYILRAIRAGRCRERRYADHIFIQIYFRMQHFVVKFSKFSSPQAARGHWPP